MTDSEQDPTLGTCEKLAAKIAKVMAAIGEVPKNGHNDRFNYSYPLDEDVMKALREAMTEHGLVAIPSVAGRSMTKETTSGGTEMIHTRVQLEITLIDSDSGQQKTVHWEGEAQDQQDKGLYKAYTSGMKYWALKTFLMSAGDDVERADAASSQPKQSSGSSGSREPSDAQVEFAEDLTSSSVWSEKEQAGLEQRIANYTRSQMSDLIDSMQETIEKREAQQNGEQQGHQPQRQDPSDVTPTQKEENQEPFADPDESDDLPF